MTTKKPTSPQFSATPKPASKTAAELEALRQSAADLGSGTIVACWFKDSGGTDQCIPMDSGACTAAGGVPRAGRCPNF